MDANVEVKVNELHDQLRKDVGEVAQALKIGKAAILNATSKPVNFYVYNYVDSAYWISAMHTLVAPGKVGAVMASGAAFKVHPDDNKTHEFLVTPGRAYIYRGPGDIDEMNK